MAIRTNPSYATAHENLGDIYAKLASQAYNKALQLDAANATSVKPKLALIRELFSADIAKGAKPCSGSPAPAVVAAQRPAPAPQHLLRPLPPHRAPACRPAQRLHWLPHQPRHPPLPDAAKQEAAKDAKGSHRSRAAWAAAWAAKDMKAATWPHTAKTLTHQAA